MTPAGSCGPIKRALPDGAVQLPIERARWFGELAAETAAMPAAGSHHPVTITKCRASIRFPCRDIEVHLAIDSERHPRDIAAEFPETNLGDFVTGGIVTPIFGEAELPPRAHRPESLVCLSQLPECEIKLWFGLYQDYARDWNRGRTRGGCTWGGQLRVWLDEYDGIHFVTDDDLVVLLATKPPWRPWKRAGTDRPWFTRKRNALDWDCLVGAWLYGPISPQTH